MEPDDEADDIRSRAEEIIAKYGGFRLRGLKQHDATQLHLLISKTSNKPEQ
jgi:hypothetical protein